MVDPLVSRDLGVVEKAVDRRACRGRAHADMNSGDVGLADAPGPGSVLPLTGTGEAERRDDRVHLERHRGQHHDSATR